MGVQTADQLPGVFSSRKLERATYDLVAFRFIAVNQHPRGERLLLRRFCGPASSLRADMIFRRDRSAILRGEAAPHAQAGDQFS